MVSADPTANSFIKISSLKSVAEMRMKVFFSHFYSPSKILVLKVSLMFWPANFVVYNHYIIIYQVFDNSLKTSSNRNIGVANTVLWVS